MEMETACRGITKANDHSGFQHFNWAFHAGLTGNPIMAYELMTKIAQVSGGKTTQYDLMPGTTGPDVLIIE